ncbi:interleukin 17a/f2 [Labeo rohita]|uniref:interleukin 17a/f2 n=1 Tax=Labeo rohita TaxID=84645 RepID=UPI0021E2D3EF|nr:interleukin 17a/f2 [Labeo rohita]
MRKSRSEVLLSCALASLTFAKQGQKKLCDTSLTIDFYASLDLDAEGNGNIHNRSLSPWTWIPKYSPDRIPQFLFEAQCSSEYCVFPSGVDIGLNSLPIYQDILVLKQDTEDRKCFRVTFERVILRHLLLTEYILYLRYTLSNCGFTDSQSS